MPTLSYFYSSTFWIPGFYLTEYFYILEWEYFLHHCWPQTKLFCCAKFNRSKTQTPAESQHAETDDVLTGGSGKKCGANWWNRRICHFPLVLCCVVDVLACNASCFVNGCNLRPRLTINMRQQSPYVERRAQCSRASSLSYTWKTVGYLHVSQSTSFPALLTVIHLYRVWILLRYRFTWLKHWRNKIEW